MDLQSFGQQIKQKYPQYNSLSDVEVAQRVIKKYPQYNKQVGQGATTTIEKTGLYDIPGVGGFARAAIEPSTQMFDIQKQKKPLVGVQTPVGPMGIQNPIPAKGEIPAEVGTALSAVGTDIPGTLKGGVTVAKSIPAAIRTILHPIVPFAQHATSEAVKAGEVPANLLTEKFGTMLKPNEDLIKGLTSAGGKGPLLKALKDEIVGQGKNLAVGTEKAANATYKDVLDWKKGAYSQAYDKTAPKALQGLYKNIGKAYKDILHTNVPSIKRADNIQTALFKLEKVAPGILKALGLSAGAVEGINLLKNTGK